MPGKLKVKVLAGRGLPVMDRSTDLTDAFVEIKFGPDVQKSDVYKKSLQPQWNSDWFIFEAEDELLQDEPLELRVMDHDTYSAHDVIGKVYIDLNPLLVKDSPAIISGWFPIYDTMHGIRGDVNVIVKIDLFSDFNKFRQSSCGVQFFCTADVPMGYKLQYVHGFVEELVVNDDPEYQWIDKIRTPRASNEARQRLFSKMSGLLTRKIGVKVLEMGGAAVIGYSQCFDLEGESGIVIRGIGTAVTLLKIREPPSSPQIGVSPLKDSQRHHLPGFLPGGPSIVISTNSTPSTPVRRSAHLSHPHMSPFSCSAPHTAPVSSHSHVYSSSPHHASSSLSHFAFDFTCSSPVPEETIAPASPPGQNTRSSTSPVKVVSHVSSRRESDSDVSTPPRGNSLGGSSGSGSGVGSGNKSFHKLCSQQVNIELMEFPLFTMSSFPPGFIVHLGGVVAARSVKLLDKIHNPEEPETRDAWWTEIRTEIRSHTRTMGCHAVVGYTESTSICDEIIIISAMGTAARVNLNLEDGKSSRHGNQQLLTAVERHLQIDKEKDQGKKLFVDVNLANQMSQRGVSRYESSEEGSPRYNCSLCHIPYKAKSAPFPIHLTHCAVCRKRYVPDVLFTTINPPPEVQTFGKGAFLQARICRAKADSKAEANAKQIGDILPFMEYELHNQLINKLKMRSMNGLFGLKIQIVVGENMLIGVASATGAYIVPLPTPAIPRILGHITSEDDTVTLQALQKQLADRVQKYKEFYQLSGLDVTGQPSPHSVHTDDSDDEGSDLELSSGNKETFVLEVDDTKDETVKAMLEDTPHPAGMDLCNTEVCPGLPFSAYTRNLQMFTQVLRKKIDVDHRLKIDFKEMFQSLYRKLYFKLRRTMPCCLCNLDFNVEVPEEDEVQIVVTGICVAIDDSQSNNSSFSDQHLCTPASSKGLLKPVGLAAVGASGENIDDMMFTMEEVTEASGTAGTVKAVRLKPEGSVKHRQHQVKGRQINGIEVTPLSSVAGARIEKYIGSYNFFFIRETTAVKEVGGVGGFMHNYLAEVLAIVRAHVSSLGGNALVAYKMTQCVLLTNEHKNQSQCLINVSGDAVLAVPEGEVIALVPEHTRKHSDSPILPAYS